MNTQQWHIKKDGKTFGPFTTEQIKGFAASNKLLPTHELASSPEGPWSLASIAKGLFAAAPSPAKDDALEAAATAAVSAFANSASAAMGLTTNLLSKAKSAMTKLETVTDAALAKFTPDGQNVAVVSKVHGRVSQLCTNGEVILYLAVQALPNIISPDSVVVTNRRFMIFRAKMLSKLTFFDCLWKDCSNVHLDENIIGSTIKFKCLDGREESLEYLPKAQARQIYRNAQEQEELAIATRRNMQLEELQAGADRMVLNQAIGVPTAQPVTVNAQPVDVVAKLNQLKGLLDSGIINADEFAAKKLEFMKLL